MAESHSVLLDLNNPVFQDDLFGLEKAEASRVLATLQRVRKLTWPEVYRDKGLHWELVQSKKGPHGARLYTVRVSAKVPCPRLQGRPVHALLIASPRPRLCLSVVSKLHFDLLVRDLPEAVALELDFDRALGHGRELVIRSVRFVLLERVAGRVLSLFSPLE